jgi:hypothetical protein
VTGALEILNPILALVDGALDWTSATIRLLLWGVIAGAASMGLYRLLSPQGRLRELAERAREARRSPPGGAAGASMTGLVQISGRRLLLTLAPTLVSCVPILFVLGFLNATYDLDPPEAGVPVAVLSGDGDAIAVEGGQRFAEGWTVAWPGPGEKVRVFDAQGRPIYTLTADTRPGAARERGPTALLLGAPAGLIAPESSVDSLEIVTAPRSILQAGLDLRYQWIFPFLLSLVATSLLIKPRYRII